MRIGAKQKQVQSANLEILVLMFQNFRSLFFFQVGFKPSMESNAVPELTALRARPERESKTGMLNRATHVPLRSLLKTSLQGHLGGLVG